MDKKRLFSQLEKWPLINFDHAKVILDGDYGSFNVRTSLYAYDCDENKAKLFIRDVPTGTDTAVIAEIYTAWIKEYKK
ncbi:hypothetical protein ACFL9S_06195 [Erwinia sp. AnSW2-5]|uniref:hypothetical protein n=1 Tax=Erwinia sp. AnSW2-5 TaxID=3367692 RepID=UPI00385A3184